MVEKIVSPCDRAEHAPDAQVGLVDQRRLLAVLASVGRLGDDRSFVLTRGIHSDDQNVNGCVNVRPWPLGGEILGATTVIVVRLSRSAARSGTDSDQEVLGNTSRSGLSCSQRVGFGAGVTGVRPGWIDLDLSTILS